MLKLLSLLATGLAAGVIASPAQAQMTMQQCLAKNYTYNVCKNYPAAASPSRAPRPGQTVRREDDNQPDPDAGLRPEAIWPAYGCWSGGNPKACDTAQKDAETEKRPALLDFPDLLRDRKYSLDLPDLTKEPALPDDKLTLPRP